MSIVSHLLGHQFVAAKLVGLIAKEPAIRGLLGISSNSLQAVGVDSAPVWSLALVTDLVDKNFLSGAGSSVGSVRVGRRSVPVPFIFVSRVFSCFLWLL